MPFQVLQETWDLHKWLTFFYFCCHYIILDMNQPDWQLYSRSLNANLHTCEHTPEDLHKGKKGDALKGDFQVECPPLKAAICWAVERLKNYWVWQHYPSTVQNGRVASFRLLSLLFVCLSVCFSPSIILSGSLTLCFSSSTHFFLIAL